MPTNGAEQLRQLSAALRKAGRNDLRKELASGLRRAIKPMKKEFQRGALGILPHRGGLAEWVAGSTSFRTRVNTGANPSVSIAASLKGHDLEAMDNGELRHPTFGHRNAWVSQAIRPGWWTDSGILAAQDARDELDKALDDFARKLEAEA